MSVQITNGAILIDGAPDWNESVELGFQWRTEIATSLTGVEDRFGLRDSPGTTLSWTLSTVGVPDCANAAEQIRRALGSGAAAAPCHPRAGQCTASTLTTITLADTPWPWAAGDWVYVLGQARQIVSVVGGELTVSAPFDNLPAAGSPVYPLMFGRLECDDALQLASDAFKVRCHLHAKTWAFGAAAPPTLYRGAPLAPGLLAATGVGKMRRKISAASVDGAFEFAVSLSGENELSTVEYFLQSVGGRRDSFWLPSPEIAMVLQSGTTNSCVIAAQGLADQLNPGRDTFLWFVHPTLPPMAARITSVAGGAAGTEVVTLEETLPQPLDANWDAFRLQTVRLAHDDVRETFGADGVATLRISVVATPNGAMQGQQPTYLYRFQARLNSAQVWCVTNRSSAVVYSGETYLPSSIAHREAEPGRFSVRGLVATFPADDAVDVVIRRLDANETIFTGRVGQACGDEIALLPPFELGTRLLPSFRVGASCNHRLFGAGCGLNADDWKVTGALAAQNGANVTLAVDPGKADNWFAGGRIVAGTERRAILASSGATLLLGDALRMANVGDPLTAYAGCTHLVADCHAKFDNLARFGGHPFLAERQPVRVLPQLAGWQRLGVAQIGAPFSWTDGYRANLLVAICRGPVDAITHIWIDGQLTGSAGIVRGSEEHVDIAIPGRGVATLFWGLPNQAAQPDLAALGHPAYVGQCYLWMPSFLIGADPTKLPVIEVAVKRYPVVSWLDSSAVNDDANPAVALASILLDAGMDATLFDQPAWSACATRLANEDNVCSPLLDRELSYRDLIDTLCSYIDGFVNWTPDGKLQLLLRREAPADLSFLPTFTAADLLAPAKVKPVPRSTRTLLTCGERDRGWTRDDDQSQDDNAFAILQEEVPQVLHQPWITRRAAAARVARRLIKAASPARLSGTLRVRLSSASEASAGSWLILNLADGATPLSLQCLRRVSADSVTPAADLFVVSAMPSTDDRELFDRGDSISHDAPLPV